MEVAWIISGQCYFFDPFPLSGSVKSSSALHMMRILFLTVTLRNTTCAVVSCDASWPSRGAARKEGASAIGRLYHRGKSHKHQLRRHSHARRQSWDQSLPTRALPPGHCTMCCTAPSRFKNCSLASDKRDDFRDSTFAFFHGTLAACRRNFGEALGLSSHANVKL
jgi:hypothetical protein